MSTPNKKISYKEFHKFEINNFVKIKERLINTLVDFDIKQLLEVEDISKILYQTLNF